MQNTSQTTGRRSGQAAGIIIEINSLSNTQAGGINRGNTLSSDHRGKSRLRTEVQGTVFYVSECVIDDRCR